MLNLRNTFQWRANVGITKRIGVIFLLTVTGEQPKSKENQCSFDDLYKNMSFLDLMSFKHTK
jgi:hypothetical protein